MMTPEIWTWIAAALLGLATVAGWLAVLALRGRWEAIVFGSRFAALTALIVALIAAAMQQGHWSASDTRQVMLSLIAAILLVHLALAWRSGAGTAGPMVDLVALVLSLVIIFVAQAGSPEPICIQLPALYQMQWGLLLLGGAGVLVAACAGLMLILRKVLSSRGWDGQLPGWGAMHGLLAQSTVLALAILGCGLVIGVWWAWQTSGTLAWNSARETWMAVAWLITAMSLLAWQVEGRRSRWAAGLALVAAIAVLVGLLSPADLPIAAI